MIEQCIATNLDIFCMGVLLGIVSLKIGEWAVKFLEIYLGNREKQLDLKLGQALLKMKDKL